jgi:hypothetical protein
LALLEQLRGRLHQIGNPSFLKSIRTVSKSFVNSLLVEKARENP